VPFAFDSIVAQVSGAIEGFATTDEGIALLAGCSKCMTDQGYHHADPGEADTQFSGNEKVSDDEVLEMSLVTVVYDRRWRGFVVGLRERILRLLDTDGADLDPDEFVEFAVVKLGVGPLLVERLRQAGIEAHGHETVNPATTMLTDYSVSVRRRDLAAAAEAYNE
jgi:hypothetical protein